MTSLVFIKSVLYWTVTAQSCVRRKPEDSDVKLWGSWITQDPGLYGRHVCFPEIQLLNFGW